MPRKKEAEAPEPKAPPTPEPAGVVSDDSWVAKLSIKALGCDPRLPKGVNKQVLCTIGGKAQGLKHGEDKMRGDVWTALQGTFEGRNIQEGTEDYGKVLRSGKLFLPGGIQDVIEGAVREIENSASKETASVTFGLELSSIRAANPIGYSYEARNLIPRQRTDELEEIRKAMDAKVGPLKALPAGKE